MGFLKITGFFDVMILSDFYPSIFENGFKNPGILIFLIIDLERLTACSFRLLFGQNLPHFPECPSTSGVNHQSTLHEILKDTKNNFENFGDEKVPGPGRI